MPLSQLQYTDNLNFKKTQTDHVFKTLHESMVDILDAKIASCKAQAVVINNYFIADGADQHHGFVILTMQILSGRTDEQKTKIQEVAAELLHQLIKDEGGVTHVAVRVKLVEVTRDVFQISEVSI